MNPLDCYVLTHCYFRGIEAQTSMAMDRLFVLFGEQILTIIPGRVSTEVDARWALLCTLLNHVKARAFNDTIRYGEIIQCGIHRS